MKMPRGVKPLRHTSFRLLAVGQFTSNVGDAFYAVALPWYVLTNHGGTLLLGTVLASYGIPRTALVAIGGYAADRWRPWTVMMVADTVRVLAVGALAAAATLGPASAALLIPVAAVLGAGEGLFLPGSFAIVPSLLPDDEIQAGNALTAGSTQFATLIGPAIGGIVVELLGSAPAFIIDAASFVVSAVTLAGVRSQQRAHQPVTTAPVERVVCPSTVGVEVDTRASISNRQPTLRQFVKSERVLQVILVVVVAGNLGSGAMGEVALPSLARTTFHTGASGYGGLIAAFGAGALLGTLFAAQVRRTRRPAMLASGAFLAEAVFLGLIPYLGGALPAGGALVAYGALNGLGNVVVITTFQRWAPRQLIGRLMGLLMLATFGIFPVSVLLGGLVVHDLGPAVFFPLAAGVLAIAVLGSISQPSWRNFGAMKVGTTSVSSESSI